MKPARLPARRVPLKVPQKASTGIAGFDSIACGGLPRGHTTLLVGGPGSGKTVFALKFLAHGAQSCKEPGIFVTFEEASGSILANAASFGWKLPELQKRGKLYFVDAQPSPDLIHSGDFDLGGMLAALDVKARELAAPRIVFDALNVVLAMLPDAAARRRELHRLHDWLLARGLTCLITVQAGGEAGDSLTEQRFGYMQFMVDCIVILTHGVVQGVSQRNLRVQKYRGSGFDEDEAPFLIGENGIEVAMARSPGRAGIKATMERVSTGVQRLDTMLGGGYYRGASVLITGSPGTAKTTLGGAFAAAACRRGERTLFFSFDSESAEVIRNLASVGIRLDRHVKAGTLRIIPARSIAGSAEVYLGRFKSLAKEHGARCIVIDPVSAWSTTGNNITAQGVIERLIDWAKAEGITLVCTKLRNEISSQAESDAPLKVSTLADTWIHLSYLVQAGERNRGLSIIKSRGTAHSNQVRELLLSDEGVTLTDAYTAGGEVLMGTLRWEKESAAHAMHEASEGAARLKRVKLDAEEAELKVQLQALQVALEAKQVEKALLASTAQTRKGALSQGRTRMRELRGSDAAKPGRKTP